MARSGGCEGEGRMWDSAGGFPRCPKCGKRPADFGVPMPPLKEGKTWWTGAVPLHHANPCPTPTKRAYRSEDHAFSAIPKRGPAFRTYLCRCGKWHYSTSGTLSQRPRLTQPDTRA